MCTGLDLALALLALLDVLTRFQTTTLGLSGLEGLELMLGSGSWGSCGGVRGSGPLGGVRRLGRVRDQRREGVEEVEPDLSIPELEVMVDVVCTDRRAGSGTGTGVLAAVGVKSSRESSALSKSWTIVSAGVCIAACFFRGGG